MKRIAPAIDRLLKLPEPERRLGPFVLIEPIGRGGFAPVWLAKEVYGTTELRTAAVKLFALQSTNASNTRVRDHILAEARALCRVEHPHVVRFYALPISDTQDVMGLAMEHVAGLPLGDRLQHGTLSIFETLDVGTAIASALSAVHHVGLVHRDIKPANVVESKGIYKLIDFGIAAADVINPSDSTDLDLPLVPNPPIHLSPQPDHLAESQQTLDDTRPLALRSGTIGYIDPTCLSTNAPATSASDLYALGATLFECLTGKLPAAINAPVPGYLRPDILQGQTAPPPLCKLVPHAPAALGDLIDALIAPNRPHRPATAEWVALRLDQIRGDLQGLHRNLPPDSIGPFRGLGRFEIADRDVYFGRTSEVFAAIEMLRGRGLVALAGPSGSGKSSLARAGILPQVAQGSLSGWPKQWDTAIAEPGLDPHQRVLTALAPFISNAKPQTPEALVTLLAERAQKNQRGILLLLDQLEELVTLPSSSLSWISSLLVQLAERPLPGVRALVTVRRDLLDPLLGMADIGKALGRNLVLIEPMTELAWLDVLDQAFAAYGYTLEDGFKDDLLSELKLAKTSMPLVQFALTELWNHRPLDHKTITRDSLAAIGGIAGALERHADATLTQLLTTHPQGEPTTQRILLALTTPQGTRATATKQHLLNLGGSDANDVLDVLTQSRLVVPSEQGFTLAHEALITQWTTLRRWVAEVREDRLLAEEIERDADRFSHEPEAVTLWTKRRLAFATELSRKQTVPLSDKAHRFLAASLRSETRARMALPVILSIVVFSLCLALFMYVRAVQVEKTSMAQALTQEQERRLLVEDQKQAIEQAQAREREVQAHAETQRRAKEAAYAKIDQLLVELTNARTEKEKDLLRKRIQEAEKALPPPTSTATAPTVSPMPSASSQPAVSSIPKPADTW